MYPILLKIGPLHIFTYGFFLALAFLGAIAMCGREARRMGVQPNLIYDLCFYIVLAALAGSRLLHVLLEFPYFLAHPLEIFAMWKGGLAFQGGLILSLIVAWIFMYRHQMPIWGTFDILAVGSPLGQFIGRIGCFMAGCCYGRSCELPWAVTFNHPETLALRGVPLHPAQLYESFLALGVFGFMLWFRYRKKFEGQLIGTYLLLAGLVRFAVEFFRADERGPILFAGMVTTQVIALALALSAGTFLLWRFWQHKKETCNH
jgi:phosphatidylglycerol---prolipoprotein diacylglyceryl transferase